MTGFLGALHSFSLFHVKLFEVRVDLSQEIANDDKWMNGLRCAIGVSRTRLIHLNQTRPHTARQTVGDVYRRGRRSPDSGEN
jgi:hypothetical protein